MILIICRDTNGGLISKIIIHGINSKVVSRLIQEESDALPKEVRRQFVEVVETEIFSIHEGNFARYRVSPKEFEAWKTTWHNYQWGGVSPQDM